MRLISRAEEKRMLGLIFEQAALLGSLAKTGQQFKAVTDQQADLIERQAATISEQTARIKALEEQVVALAIATIQRIYGNA